MTILLCIIVFVLILIDIDLANRVASERFVNRIVAEAMIKTWFRKRG